MKIYIRTRKEKVENAIPLFFALPTSEFETHMGLLPERDRCIPWKHAFKIPKK